MNSDVIGNYWRSVTPRKYKNSILVGDIFRCYYTTSNNEDLNIALDDLTQQYIRNGYPLKLIRQKISEVKARNFASRNNKDETGYRLC